jgi:aspartyl-tRNA synthetase
MSKNVETSGVIREERPYEPVRTKTCGELRLSDVGQKVVIAGWVQLSRDKGHFCFVDLRDRYGLTQVVVPEEKKEMYETAKKAGREWVLRVKGTVVERSNKNPEIPTGDIEVVPDFLEILNTSLVPPFLIKDETDGHEELRMKYRYLDIRRAPVREKLILRSQVAQHVRTYLTSQGFIEIETPFLVKSTPEGARDFVVPSRMNPGTFYALPQSPQLFKQLLMVGGMDKYFQIVKCFRDEELRADRQPEFTQIDCEMSYVEQEDVMNMFEGLARYVFKNVKKIDLPEFPRMSYDYALKYYGIDKPDTRFEMKFVEITDIAKGKVRPLDSNLASLNSLSIP